VKEFVVYTVMRLALFLASFGVVVGLMALFLDGRYNLFWAIILAFLISGVASFFIPGVRRVRAAQGPRGPGLTLGSTPWRRCA
jgi:Protein of unknown function (DUF4229)